MGFGKFIKSVRMAAGMTAEQFADLCKVTVKTVSRWENDKAIPRYVHWRAMMKRIHVDLEECLSFPHDRALQFKQIVDAAADQAAEKAFEKLTDRLATAPKKSAEGKQQPNKGPPEADKQAK